MKFSPGNLWGFEIFDSFFHFPSTPLPAILYDSSLKGMNQFAILGQNVQYLFTCVLSIDSSGNSQPTSRASLVDYGSFSPHRSVATSDFSSLYMAILSLIAPTFYLVAQCLTIANYVLIFVDNTVKVEALKI